MTRKPKTDQPSEETGEEPAVLVPDAILVPVDVPTPAEQAAALREELPVITLEDIPSLEIGHPLDEEILDEEEPIENWGRYAASGNIVQFVLDRGPAKGECRPAMVIKVWPETSDHAGMVQLQVFTDSDAEGRYNDQLPSVFWATSVRYDHTGQTPYTWNWGLDAD